MAKENDLIDPIAELQQAEFPELALSLYLPANPALDQPYHHAILKQLLRDWSDVMSPLRRRALEREMKRTSSFFDERSVGGWPLAIFACEPADFFEVYRLPQDVTAQLWVSRRLQLDPLLQMLRHSASLIVATDKERARLFGRVLTAVSEVAALEGKSIDRQRQGGCSAEKFQRHEDLKSEGNIKAVVDWIVLHRDAYPGPITVIGPPEAREELLAALPKSLQRAVLTQTAGPLYLPTGTLEQRLRTPLPDHG